MLVFKAIGDGNCLYNSKAIQLIHSFQKGEMDPFLDDPFYRNNVAKLLKKIAVNDELNLRDMLDDNPSKVQIKNALNALIASCTTAQGLDWVRVQKILAPGLRALVIDFLKSDRILAPRIKKQLEESLDFYIDMLSVGQHLPLTVAKLTALEKGRGSLFDDTFEGMDGIKEKICAVMNDAMLLTPEQKKRALKAWFMGEGWDLFLEGPAGIAQNGIYACEREMRVLSFLFKHAFHYYRGNLGSEPIRIDENVPNSGCILSIQRLGNHWNVLLSNTQAAKDLISTYEPQYDEYHAENMKKQNISTLQERLKEHGSYVKHQQTLELSIPEYCELYSLTKEQYDGNLLPMLPVIVLSKKVSEEKVPDQGDQAQLKKEPLKKVEVKKAPVENKAKKHKLEKKPEPALLEQFGNQKKRAKKAKIKPIVPAMPLSSAEIVAEFLKYSKGL